MYKLKNIAVILLAMFSITSAANGQGKAKKPNIVFILADDAGYADFSFQSNRLIPTPNIDKIAAGGVKFSNAYVTGAVCGPSRAGILTGLNQATFGQVYNFIQKSEYSLPLDSLGLPVSQKLIGDYLKPLGYSTGIIGKWHEGFAQRFHPNSRGFDHFWGFLWGSSPYNPGQATLVQENNKPVPAASIPYMTDAIGNESISFIERQAHQPFFLYVSFNAPHTPMQAKQELLKKYEGKFTPKGRALNAAMTESLDENVGRILQKLEDLKLLDNTIVVFTNDNGGQTVNSFADNFPLRGRKGEVYEGGIRVPMAIMWKGKIKPGSNCDIPVTTLDLMPAFINAAGDKASRYKALQGTDIIKLSSAASHPVGRPLFWYIGKDRGAIRQGNWKMVFGSDQAPELYDLSKDISESTDLAAQRKDIAGKLSALYTNWKVRLPQPVWVPLGDGIE